MDPRRDDRSFERSSRSHHDDVEYGIAMTKVTARLFTRNKPLTLTVAHSGRCKYRIAVWKRDNFLMPFLARRNVGLISATC